MRLTSAASQSPDPLAHTHGSQVLKPLVRVILATRSRGGHFLKRTVPDFLAQGAQSSFAYR